MKTFLGIIFIFFILIIANYGAVSNSLTNAKGIEQYNNQNFSGSLDSFLEVQNKYNMANSYYELGDYQNAIDIYEELSDEENYIYHNLGNSYYKLAQQETINISNRIDLLKKSLLNYESAQILQDDKRTIKNIEIVKKELSDLENLNQNKNSETEQENQDGESDSGGEESSESEGGKAEDQNEENGGDGENEGESGEKSGEEAGGGEGESQNSETGGAGEDGGSSGLTEQEQEAIDNYEQRLENSQGDYGQFYNKIYNDQSSDFDRIFGNDSRFDNGLLDNEEKKDW